MPTYVVDTSVVGSFLMPDEVVASEVVGLFKKYVVGEVKLIAPRLLNLEVANLLKRNTQRKRITPVEARALYQDFIKLGIVVEAVNEIEVLNLAFENNLTAYDAAYIWLSREKKAKLLSFDRDLIPFTS